MERKVTHAEQRLNAYAKRAGMSLEGKQWLMASVDPFHDKPLAINGYPDGTAGKSIVQCIKLAADISKPSGLTAGSTWDCLITTSNFLNSFIAEFLSSPVSANTVIIPAIASNYSCAQGGLVITKGQSGAQLRLLDTGVPTTTSTTLSVPNSVFEGKLRVIAVGFEVQNTSNALYKNGSVTCFELPSDIAQDAFTLNIQNGSIFGAASFITAPVLPSSIATATQLPGAKSWEAKDGCYCVARQAALLNPPKSPSHLGCYIPLDDGSSSFPLNVPSCLAGPITNPPQAPVGAINQTFAIPFHSKGAYFTNLSPETTLKVCYNVWIERFPSVNQTDLLSLATESCDYDVEALEAWSTIASQMPCGVTFEENGLGDWFTGQVASLIDGLTGTKFASGIDSWQKEKFNGVAQDPAQVEHARRDAGEKRNRMNTKAAVKGKAPKQGPMLPDGAFKHNKK